MQTVTRTVHKRWLCTFMMAAVFFLLAYLLLPTYFTRQIAGENDGYLLPAREAVRNVLANSSPLPARETARSLINSDILADRCSPAPVKFHITDPLFDCSWTSSLSSPCKSRLRAKLVCNQSSADIMYEWVPADVPPSAYSFEDDCLARVVKAKCHAGDDDGKVIPNLSHHVMFGGQELHNYTFLGVVSAVRFLQPCLVLIHADVLPTGRYWDSLVRLFPHLIHVQRSAPTVIFGNVVKVIEHTSDIARLEAVNKFGGLYQDTDYVLFNPVEDLRKYSVVMGKTIPNVNYCNCIFMGRPSAPFLNAWYDSYRTFDDKNWGFHSTIVPYRIHRERPDLEFHEVDTFVQPWFKNIREQFYDNFLDWKRLHGLHLYVRFNRQYFLRHFDQQNSSLGQVFRHIMFGDSEACFGGSGLNHPVVRMKDTLTY